jgi:acetolactate synthase-1/3 small subunit
MITKSIYAENTNSEQERDFTISILSENSIGMLHAVTIIFTRRKVNIESINASDSEVAGVYRYTIVIKTKRSTAEKVVKQIEKLVDVLAAFLYEQDQVHYQEIALYKISKKILAINPEIQDIISNHGAKVLPTEPEYEFVIYEKTGHKTEITKLLKELEVYGVSEFVKSARISVSKSKRETKTLIEQLENSRCNLIDA